MDDQGLEPHSAPPATSEPGAPSQPPPPWRIPQPAQPQASAPLLSAAPGAEPPTTMPGATPAAPTPDTGPYPLYPPSPYPTYPGTALTPPGAYPETSATPYYPVTPAPYPYAPSFPAAATIPFAPQRRLARPFPLWLTAVIAVGSPVLLVAVFLAVSLAGGQDWAGSAQVAGIVAVVLALGAIALFFVRLAAGRRTNSAIALGVVGIVLLASVAVGGLAGTAPIHALQARSLEAGGSWSAAVHEYALSGAHAPNAPDIARVYDEWGEQLLQDKSFSSAVERFNTVINTYASSGAAAVDRANLGLLHTYGAWVTAGTGTVPYAAAIAFFSAYAANSACDATCRAQAATYEAQGRFQYGQQLATQGLYQGAITQFEAIQSRFPTSSYAPQAHAAAAKAYLALGKQQINGSTCTTLAVATYQTLAKNYGDTPEGKQAQAALKAPVTVTGHISGPYPRNPTPTAVLSTHIDPNNFVYSSEYTTSIDGGSGSFTFHNVKQGSYNFSTVAYLPGVIDYVYWQDQATSNLYFVKVGPLCTVTIDSLDPYPSS